MTKFEEELRPIQLWVKNKLEKRIPYSEVITINICAALIKQYNTEQLSIDAVMSTFNCENCYARNFDKGGYPCVLCVDFNKHKAI
jgi:hypothetical protein